MFAGQGPAHKWGWNLCPHLAGQVGLGESYTGELSKPEKVQDKSPFVNFLGNYFLPPMMPSRAIRSVVQGKAKKQNWRKRPNWSCFQRGQASSTHWRRHWINHLPLTQITDSCFFSHYIFTFQIHKIKLLSFMLILVSFMYPQVVVDTSPCL